MRIVLLLLLLLPLFGVPAAQAEVPAEYKPLDPEFMGMVIRDPWYDYGTAPGQPDQPNRAAQERMGQVLSTMGVRWVRLEFRIEGTDAFSTTQIARNDYFINEVAPRYNLKVLGLLSFGLMASYAPQELNNTSTITTDVVYGGGTNDYMRSWLNRARMVAARYEGRVAAYEILNEQNRLPPNADAIKAAVAGRLQTKFYRFFRQVDRALPNQSWRDAIQIIVGGLHPAGTGERGRSDFLTDRDYLRALYASDGFRDYKQSYGVFPLDGLAYHPYPEEIRTSLADSLELIDRRMLEVRSVLAEVGDPFRLFWVTEIGYNAAYSRQTVAGQGEFMQAVYRGLAQRGDVATIFWFKYEDFPPASGPNAQRWGVVRIPFTTGNCPGGACYEVNGEPAEYRYSYFAYRELAGRPFFELFVPVAVR
jgi:hypothetical protein